IEIEKKNASNVLPATQASRASLGLAEHNWADAESFALQSIAGYEAQGGKEQPNLWRPLTFQAQARLAQGDAKTARELLERAVAIGDKAQAADDDLKPTRDALAALPKP